MKRARACRSSEAKHHKGDDDIKDKTEKEIQYIQEIINQRE